MDIESVNEKLSVTTNGNVITGSVEAENAEASLEDPNVQYASVFFFNFTNGPESGELRSPRYGCEKLRTEYRTENCRRQNGNH